MNTQLGNLIDEILRRKSWVQQDLADYIGIRQPAVSKMRHSEDWNHHWQIFLKLLPIIITLKILRPEQLFRTSDNEHGRRKAPKTEGNSKKRQGRDIMSTNGRLRFAFQ